MVVQVWGDAAQQLYHRVILVMTRFIAPPARSCALCVSGSMGVLVAVEGKRRECQPPPPVDCYRGMLTSPVSIVLTLTSSYERACINRSSVEAFGDDIRWWRLSRREVERSNDEQVSRAEGDWRVYRVMDGTVAQFPMFSFVQIS